MPARAIRTVLSVEDDDKIAALVEVYLTRAGYQVARCSDGAQVMATFTDVRPDFVILDLMLPNLDGWEVCRRLRRVSSVPILILTAREEEPDRVLGLKLGADDYVVKPFSPRELVARVDAILRRTEPNHVRRQSLEHGSLRLDVERHEVSRDRRPISLTPSEFTLLHTLMSAPGRVFSRAELLDALYPKGETVVDRVVDVHIGKLRQKLGDDADAPTLVATVRGLGYQLADPD